MFPACWKASRMSHVEGRTEVCHGCMAAIVTERDSLLVFYLVLISMFLLVVLQKARGARHSITSACTLKNGNQSGIREGKQEFLEPAEVLGGSSMAKEKK
jgi:hypothetical protein